MYKNVLLVNENKQIFIFFLSANSFGIKMYIIQIHVYFKMTFTSLMYENSCR